MDVTDAKMPTPKTPIRIYFCFLGICNFRKRGIGTATMTKSLTMLRAALENVTAFRSMHRPVMPMVAPQYAATGIHTKIELKKAHSPYMTRMTK